MVRDLCQKKIRTGSPPVVAAYDILVRIIDHCYEQLGLHSSCFHDNFDCNQCLICTINSPKRKAIKAKVISSRTRRKVTRKCQNVLFNPCLMEEFRVIRWAVQRDFSEGRVVSFASRFPVVLEGKMDMQLSDFTINSLNRLYAELVKVSTYCEGCFGLPTAHITAVVDQEGLLLTDPVLRGSVWCRSPCRQRVRGHQANCSTVFIGVVKLLF